VFRASVRLYIIELTEKNDNNDNFTTQTDYEKEYHKMGQYYRPTLITPDGRIICLHPNEFDSFSKLTEHSWISNDFVNAVYSLIYKSRKRVAWMGDYAYEDYDPVNEPYAQVMPFGKFRRYYNAA
jgi:hypothetical protein